MQKIKKVLWAVSEKTALSTNQPTNQPTSVNMETFSRISPNQDFFQKSGSVRMKYLVDIHPTTFYSLTIQKLPKNTNFQRNAFSLPFIGFQHKVHNISIEKQVSIPF